VLKSSKDDNQKEKLLHREYATQYVGPIYDDITMQLNDFVNIYMYYDAVRSL